MGNNSECVDKQKYWELADLIKRRLFGRIRDYLQENPAIDLSSDYYQFEENRKKIKEELHESVLKEWNLIKQQYRGNPAADWNRLKGFLYEALFYVACIDLCSFYFATDIVWMQTKAFEAPPHFEVLPLFGIIPPIRYVFEKAKEPSPVPQLEADFLILYVEGEAGRRRAYPVTFVDVKSSKKVHEWKKEKGIRQAIAALRHGCAMQLAYPLKDIEELKSLKDWETKTICPSCGNLLDNIPAICPYCKKEAYPFFRENWKVLWNS